MTIKLSTTNSVNKTLQHKALWGLETPYRDVGGRGGGDSRGCSRRASRERPLDSRDGTSFFFFFPLSEIHRILYQFRRSGDTFYLSSSVNKLSQISRSRTTWFQTVKLWRRNKTSIRSVWWRISGGTWKWNEALMWAGDYVWIICAAVFSPLRGLQVSQVVTEKPSGPVASLT